jgi:NADPH:quinone reductase
MTLPFTHHVLLLKKFGSPDEFVVVERPVPEPAAGEVLVKVLAASVQFTDVILRKGRYPDLKDKPPLVLGYDLVGEVVGVGPGVHAVSIGQRVADLTTTGSYAQYRTLRVDRLTIVDPALDPGEATTLVLSWMIAYQLLHRDARVQKGQRLLVIGASGAVGQALVVLGKLAGCEVWGAAHDRHADLIRALGATHVDSDNSDFAKVLPNGFDVVFDGIGEGGFSRAWRAVGEQGRLSAYGFSAGVKSNAPLALVGFWLAKLWWWNKFSGARKASFVSITALRTKHPEWFIADLGTLLGMLARGEIKPRVAERIGLDAVADAHLRLERGGLEGKIVLVPDPTGEARASMRTA